MKSLNVNNHIVLVDDDFSIPETDLSVRSKNGYLRVYRKRDGKYAANIILGKTPAGLVADHIDRNGLNNTRQNLRFTTYTVNRINSKSFLASKGVYQCKYSGKWYARIKDGKERRNLGSFLTENEAIAAYKVEQQKLLATRGGTT